MRFTWKEQLLEAITKAPHDNLLSGWLILLLGLFILGISAFDTVPKLLAYRWVAGGAVVTDTDMYQRTGRSHAWCGRVGYRYVVNGHTYKSRNLSSSFISDVGCNGDKEKLTARLAAYSTGTAIRIFYAPDAPERVAMVREGLKWHDYLFFLLALAPLSIGAYCIVQARRVLNH